MVKYEQSKSTSNQSVRATVGAPATSYLPLPLPTPTMYQAPSTLPSQRSFDPNAIDITSTKGQFAWEKLPQCEVYLPVIFRGETKYFCVRMLRKVLLNYPEDVIRRSSQYQYRKPIDTHSVTLAEIELLNRINSHHSRWTYARQPFNTHDELVRVSDFLPFYEHLRHNPKPVSALPNTSSNTLRTLLPTPQQTVQRSSDYISNMPIIVHAQSTAQQATAVHTSSYLQPTESSRENIPRSIPLASNVPRPPRPSKTIGNPYAVVPPQRPPQHPTPQQRQQNHQLTAAIPSNVSPTSTASNHPQTVPNTNAKSPIVNPPCSSALSIPTVVPSPIIATPSVSTTTSSSSSINRKLSSLSSSSSSSMTATTIATTAISSKQSPLHCGWLQINKLYTPYVSPSAIHHHLYKIPVSLLSFYELLKTPKTEVNDTDTLLSTSSSSSSSSPPSSLSSYGQTPITSQEIELINELCIKQNIKPFAVDTKLIQLSTFYEQCSANFLFVKELPLDEPKQSICKEWASIVQINGGICRLRNIATLNEQTVPFVGDNLLKTFVLSPQSLLTASLTKPTTAELEFLQLILFFSNMSINLCDAQLIDIETVKKEYNVDLILLFNDKFPLNVLNYQQQENRSNASEQLITQTNCTATTNTIAASTPPPSPPSPLGNRPSQAKSISSQLPLTSSTNRCSKMIQFHGHPLMVYICSGLGMNFQRECVSVRSLCKILYPDSEFTDKIEARMLRLLRSKNVNRFRPQNQQSLGLSRLIDLKDAEKHWDFIEKEMSSLCNGYIEPDSRSSLSSTSNDNIKTNTMDSTENHEQLSSDAFTETNKGEKRILDEVLEDEDIPISERINKRVRIETKENDEHQSDTSRCQLNSMQHGKRSDDDQIIDNIQTVQSNSTINKKPKELPSKRTKKKSKASWVKKYNIEECCVLLNSSSIIKD